jgi:acetyl-CoA carboxylase biotin carboxylase subunit
MRVALRQTRIDGIATNLALHTSILDDDAFRGGAVTTGYLQKESVSSHV